MFNVGPYTENTFASYTNPFRTLGAQLAPMSMRELMYYAEYIWTFFGRYANGVRRKLSYFLTDPEFDGCSSDEQEQWTSYVNDHLRIKEFNMELDEDEACYGNGFSTFIVPFIRFLQCPSQGCGSYRLTELLYTDDFDFVMPPPNSKGPASESWFHARCPKCGYKGQFIVDDKRDDRKESLRLKKWSPHDIDIVHDIYSCKSNYLWKIPQSYKQDLRNWRKSRNSLIIENVPKQVLKAISQNLQFRFHDDAFFHMKSPVLGGILNYGWGLPKMIANLHTILNVQVLKKMNEAIGMEFVVPMRVISPAQTLNVPVTGGTSPFAVFSGQDIQGHIKRFIAAWRKDPAAVHTSPLPLQMQMLGGGANQLAPKDLLEYGEATMMDEIDVPVELWRGSMQLQAMPIALRLFESSNKSLVYNNNSFLNWVCRRVASELNWQKPKAAYKRVTIVDDAEKRSLMMSMYASQQVSGRTALKGVDLDWKSEQKQLANEAGEMAEFQADQQRKLEQKGLAAQIMPGATGSAATAAQGGAAGGGGGAAPAGASDPTTGQPAGPVDPSTGQPAGPVTSYLMQSAGRVPEDPQELQSLSSSLAQQLVRTPDPTRQSELSKLRNFNSFLHDLVTSQMKKSRSQIRSQAGSQALSGMQGQQAA